MARHEHEWTEPDFEPDAGYVYIYQQCTWEEITGSMTSEKWDETFYETGAGCEANRTISYLMDEIVHDEARGLTMDLMDEQDSQEIADALGISAEYPEDVYVAVFDMVYEQFKQDFLADAHILHDDGFPNEVEVWVGSFEANGEKHPRFMLTFELEHYDEDVY